MGEQYVLSGRDREKLTEMFRWWERNKNIRPIPQRRNVGAGSGVSANIIKIFAVQSEAAGDGIYNCYEQSLDATEWDDTTGDPKFDNLNTTSVEVLNLAEHKPESEYVAQLSSGDLLAAWRKPDDEHNSRWIGVPFRQANADRSRLAFCKDNAGATTSIDCYLDVDGDGTVVSVKGNSSPKDTNLDQCIRKLKDGDPILVQKISADWYAIEGFQAIDTNKGLEISGDKLAVQVDTDKGIEFSAGKIAAKLDTTELQFEDGGISTKLFECP